ncbi:MAG: PstS family phosphate ABC transporter substrate-binding protein [Nitrospira sp.]|nr:PstS family phosphate ABC transporter substrate-binding protein [Nitrospira sp.]
MMRSVFRVSVVAGLIGILIGPSVSEAQLKPVIDPQIQSYAKAAGVSGGLTVAGSEMMKALSHRWESKLREFYPGLTIQIQGIGSETGPPALLEGKAQIAAMSRQLTKKEIEEFRQRYGYEPTEVPVAADALSVFVHRDNPISGMTLPELDAVFCKEHRRGLNEDRISWSQFGLSGEWSEASIALIGRNKVSGTATFFREQVCGNGDFKDTLKTEAGSASVVMGIKKDRYAVGFSGIGYRTSSVKPVPLAVAKDKPFIEPTFETVTDGTYPLRRHLFLYVNKSPKAAMPAAVTEFVKFAVSLEGQQAVIQEGFFPLPTAQLNSLFAAWSQPLQAATAPHAIPARD